MSRVVAVARRAHPLHGDHLAVQLRAVQVGDAAGGLVAGGHGDEAVAAGSRALGVGHHLGPDHLEGEGGHGGGGVSGPV